MALITGTAVDCEWNDWTVGTCSVTCGDGIRTNTRTEKVAAAYGGEECNGSASIQESCNIQVCPGMERTSFLCNIHIFVPRNNISFLLAIKKSAHINSTQSTIP